MNAMRRRRVATSLALTLALGGCFGGGSMPPGGHHIPDNCVTFNVLSQDSFQPSVVRISFQLSKCNGEPLPGKVPADFIITEDGKQVSQFESAQDFVTDERCSQLVTVLVLDMSGSILDSGSLPDLQAAAIGFVESVVAEQTIAVYTFDGREHMQLLADFTNDVDVLRAAIESLSNYQVVDRSTNLNGAVVEGLGIVDAKLGTLDHVDIKGGSLVLFTDGTDQAARVSDATAIEAAATSPDRIYAIGLGGEINVDALTMIGKDGHFISDDVQTLQDVFGQAAAAIRGAAQSYYILAYCSPKRSGTHQLELSLDGLNGSATYDFVADGFEGGCTPDDFIGAVGCGGE